MAERTWGVQATWTEGWQNIMLDGISLLKIGGRLNFYFPKILKIGKKPRIGNCGGRVEPVVEN